jgi:RNA polymerase sigma-70 factor (sigma-E family)
VDAEDEFAAYMAARWPALLRTAVLLGCAPHDAEDVAQTALSKCYVSWQKVARADDRDAYVYRVLVNAYNDSRRRHWWGERPSSDLTEPEASVDPTAALDESEAVDRALEDLDDAQRAVVVLRFFADLTEAQTAKVLGVPVGTVKSRQSRALRQLADSQHLTDRPNRSKP